jgi:uncharacterized RDD family membrane protein YckC
MGLIIFILNDRTGLWTQSVSIFIWGLRIMSHQGLSDVFLHQYPETPLDGGGWHSLK